MKISEFTFRGETAGAATATASGRGFDARIAEVLGRRLGDAAAVAGSNAGVPSLGLFADERRAEHVRAARERLTGAADAHSDVGGSPVHAVPSDTPVEPSTTPSDPSGQLRAEEDADTPARTAPGAGPEGADAGTRPGRTRETAPAPDQPGPAPARSSDAAWGRTGVGAAATSPTAGVGQTPSVAIAGPESAPGGESVGIRGVSAARATPSAGGTLPGMRSESAAAAPRGLRGGVWKQEHAELAQQVERGIAAAVRQRGGTVTIRLRPETLGFMRIHLQFAREVVSVRLEASQEVARALLEGSLDHLRSALETRGLKVDRLDVVGEGSAAAQDAPGDRGGLGTGGAGYDRQGPAWESPDQRAGHGSGQDARPARGSARTPTIGNGQPEPGTDSGPGQAWLGGAGNALITAWRVDAWA